MAHFYAEVKGSRGAVHRLGGKSGGATAEVRSWHDGVRIVARYDAKFGENYYEISTLRGSSGGGKSEFIGTIRHDGTIILQGGEIR